MEDFTAVTCGADYDSWRIINNLMLNYRTRKNTQISLHYGAKYVQEKIEGTGYSGYTDLIGAEGRYDVNKYWDVGLHGSILHSWKAAVFDYSGGMSVGYNVAQNAWLSLGYNPPVSMIKTFLSRILPLRVRLSVSVSSLIRNP